MEGGIQGKGGGGGGGGGVGEETKSEYGVGTA